MKPLTFISIGLLAIGLTVLSFPSSKLLPNSAAHSVTREAAR
jgi:hypothetical protein